jgi:mannose-1-phosphate guanylyltransferase
MDGVILAGGLGTRLHPVTLEIPKPLIPVQGKPLTDHLYDVFYRAGVKNVVLSLGYMHDPIVARYVPEAKGEFKGEKYTIPTRWVRDEMNGTGAWIKMMNLQEMKMSDPFLVANGDNLCAVDYQAVVEAHKKNGAEITIVLRELEDVSAFGVADMDGERIKSFVEKPAPGEEPSKLISTGYYVFSSKILGDFDHLFPAGDDPEELKAMKVMLENDVFPAVAERGGLYGYNSEDLWFDTGTFERWTAVIKDWKLP